MQNIEKNIGGEDLSVDVMMINYFLDDVSLNSLKDIETQRKRLKEKIFDLWENSKDNDPISFKDFLLAHNNIQGHFNDSFIGSIYKNHEHYKLSLTEDGFIDLSNDIKSLIKDADEKANPSISKKELETGEIKEIYYKLYDAYLIMRKHIKEKDIEIFE
jgi:hypothetical protein